MNKTKNCAIAMKQYSLGLACSLTLCVGLLLAAAAFAEEIGEVSTTFKVLSSYESLAS